MGSHFSSTKETNGPGTQVATHPAPILSDQGLSAQATFRTNCFADDKVQQDPNWGRGRTRAPTPASEKGPGPEPAGKAERRTAAVPQEGAGRGPQQEGAEPRVPVDEGAGDADGRLLQPAVEEAAAAGGAARGHTRAEDELPAVAEPDDAARRLPRLHGASRLALGSGSQRGRVTSHRLAAHPANSSGNAR